MQEIENTGHFLKTGERSFCFLDSRFRGNDEIIDFA
jgi:hypothetical protein